uniref:Uncharacterized protein n=1 Tax=Strigamia maritima TaxID=126957 RepID=T1IVW5_STRMM
MSVPITKRRFDDIPRLDIPLSPDTGDETYTTTESTPTSTVLSPSQSGDGSLVTVDSWKSGNWPSGANCLCRRSKSTPFSPKVVKEDSKIIVVDVTKSEVGVEECANKECDQSVLVRKASTDKMMQVDPDVDEMTVRLDFKMNGRASNSSLFKTENKNKEEEEEEDAVDENESEEINVSLKPINLKSDSEGNEEGSSLKGTESFTYASELSNQIHSPTSVEKVSWPIFNNTTTSNSNPETTKLAVKYQRSDLHARIKSMIDFGKSLLSSRISEQGRSSCTTVSSIFSSRGKCESESQLSTIKSSKRLEMSEDKTGPCWNNKPEKNYANFQDKIGSKLSSPQLCLLNSAKFNSPSSSDDWYDTADDGNDKQAMMVNNEEEVGVSPTPNTSDTVMTTTDSDSAILLSTVGVQVDLIAWDLMGKEPAEVRDIGVQVCKKGQKEAHGTFPAIRRPAKKRTVYFDLSTPKQIAGVKSEVPSIYYDIKESESEMDSEQDQYSDLRTLSANTSQEIIKSPFTHSPKDAPSKTRIIVKEDGYTVTRKISISETESSRDEMSKSTEGDTAPSKTQSEDTYTIDLTNHLNIATKANHAIPVAISNLTSDNKARWLKDIKSKIIPQNVGNAIPAGTPTRIPSSTKIVRDTVKKASTSLTQVNSKQSAARKFQSPQPGERIKSMDEMRKLSEVKGIQRYRGMLDTQLKKI